MFRRPAHRRAPWYDGFGIGGVSRCLGPLGSSHCSGAALCNVILRTYRSLRREDLRAADDHMRRGKNIPCSQLDSHMASALPCRTMAQCSIIDLKSTRPQPAPATAPEPTTSTVRRSITIERLAELYALEEALS